MKKFYAILCLAIASLTQLQAQAPQGFNYQATVRNSSGDLIVNTNVYFKFNVIQGSQTAVPIFTETHYVPTDDLGQVNLVIGQGTANTGTFSELDWSLGSYYLGIELNTGSGYVAMGTTQLLSVPYALYAENSGNSTPTMPTLQSVLAENNSAGQQQIKDLLDPTEDQDAVTKNYTYSKAEVDALLANLQSQINVINIASIFISADLSQIEIGDTTTFSAVSNSGVDITNDVTFSVDGNPISGNSHTFQDEGLFSITASYENIISNTITINVSVPLSSITLSSNSNSYFLGDIVEFQVTGNNGENLTNQATISMIGSSDLSGNQYTTTAEGVFSFTATYDSFTSPEYEIAVLPAPTKFNQNVLIEDYTGTWCGYCPRISYAIELVEQQTTDAYVVAIHRGSTDPGNSSYDPYNFSAGTLEDLIGLQGYPTGMLNRTTEWIYPEPNNVSQVVNLASGQADVGLALSPTLNGNTMIIDVNVKFGGQFSASNAKLVVYVLEDGLVFNQTNYTSYYGGGSVIANFEHNHVLRASLTSLLGDQIPSSEFSADNVYQVNFNVPVPSNITSTENMSVVAVVINGSSNAAINVRGADFGDTQTFEEL